eukprot:scaffold3671_cov248-Prasinococcus_capsulatus_cf.AAC.1
MCSSPAQGRPALCRPNPPRARWACHIAGAVGSTGTCASLGLSSPAIGSRPINRVRKEHAQNSSGPNCHTRSASRNFGDWMPRPYGAIMNLYLLSSAKYSTGSKRLRCSQGTALVLVPDATSSLNSNSSCSILSSKVAASPVRHVRQVMRPPQAPRARYCFLSKSASSTACIHPGSNRSGHGPICATCTPCRSPGRMPPPGPACSDSPVP